MPVKFRITLVFTFLVTVILALVCGSIYYFSADARENTVKRRLTNRAITTARLLSYSQTFNRAIVERIDSLTTLSLKHKAVIAFDYAGDTIYNYAESVADFLRIAPETLQEAKVQGNVFFAVDNREAVAYHYIDNNVRMVIITAAYDEEGRITLNKLQNILLLSFLFSIVLTFSVGIIFSQRLLQPLQQIASEVKEISVRNLSRRIPTGTANDEWKQLTLTLNGLLDRINETFELQKNFIANASHELSTPLTAASGQIQVVLQRERTSEEYIAALRSALDDIHNMNRLTKMLLEFTKASADQGNLITGHVRTDEILLKLPAVAAASNPIYRIRLHFENLPSDETALLAYGSEDLLFTAVKNIALNGCKFAEDHTAEVFLHTDQKNIIIRIRNIGSQITDEERPYIFEPFYRGKTNSEGFGLGLSLAQKIIRLHHGSIQLNTNFSGGTEFILTLPQVNSNAFLIQD